MRLLWGPPLVFHNLSRCEEAEDGQRTRPDRTVLRQLTDPPNAYMSSHPPMEGPGRMSKHTRALELTHICFSTQCRLGGGERWHHFTD